MPESIGEFLTDKFVQGVEELQAANAGQMAMDAPPIQPTEAPAAEPPAPDYSEMLAQQSAMSQGRDTQDMEMSR